jgi:hypothetical protein
VVNDTTSISDTSILLNGNLIVQPAGRLTLTNVAMVVNCSFSGQYRIDVLAGGELHIVGCNLSSANLSSGYLFWTSAGSVLEISGSRIGGVGSPYQNDGGTYGILVRTQNALIRDSTFIGCSEALHVEDCSLAISNCNFKDNEVGITAYNSSLTVTGCTFEDHNTSGLALYDGSDAAVSGCRFIGNFRYGLYVNRSKVTATGDSFSGNYIGFHAEYSNGSRVSGCTFQGELDIGIRFWECPLGQIEDCSVNASSRISLYVMGSHVVALNTSLNSGMYDCYLAGGSLVQLVNCSLRRNNVFFHDQNDRLEVSWYLDIQVLWWSDETPVAGADVNVSNQTGNLSFSGMTDAQGRLGGGIVPGYFMTRSVYQTLGPYTASASKNGLAADATTPVNASMELRLLLDNIGPAMQIERPSQGGFVNSSAVLLAGTAWDNETRVSRIEASIDNGSWLPANGTTSWSFTASLVDGPHKAKIRGTDTANNTNIALLDFTVDTGTPAICITSPEDWNVTRERQVNISGATEQFGNATVNVGGTPVQVDNTTGSFQAQVNLTEGDNVIFVEATDRAGNTAGIDLHIRSDTIVTPLDIYPRDGDWSNRSTITVNGTVENGSTLVIRTADGGGNFSGNGTRVNITTGNFSVNITLHNGTNLLLVEAFDGHGNSASRYLNITMDQTPPIIDLTSPATAETYTRVGRVVVSGRVEEGAALYLNGRVVLVQDGCFSRNINLDPGLNKLILTAVDQAGNVRTIYLNATLDRNAPSLLIRAPRDRTRTTGDSVQVRGSTELCATVLVNGKVANVDASGNFRRQVPLKMGHNAIDIVATDLAGNPATEHLVVDRATAPPLLYDWQIGLLTLAIIIGVSLGAVAWDTHRTTGRWALRRPAWLRVPQRILSYVPRPTFGREEFDSGPGPVQVAPRKQDGEPAEHGAPAPAAPAQPPSRPAEPLPAARLGDEFIVSQKPLSAQPGSMPAATELPAQLPVAEPSAAATATVTTLPAGAAGGPSATPGTSTGQPGGEAPPGKPVQRASAPEPPGPAEPEKPKEPLDPLAEILGHPTKRF